MTAETTLVKERPLVETVEVTRRDERELAIARLIAVPAEKLYRLWTDPASYPDWFCPKPWVAEVSVMDVRPGGQQRITMRGPDGAEHPSDGIFLAITPNRRIVFSSAFSEGFRPVPGDMPFVGEITFEPQPDGRTLYTARAMHWDLETARTHGEMGFEGGWGICAQQMAELAAGR